MYPPPAGQAKDDSNREGAGVDRKQWLTMIYREANLFLERNGGKDRSVTPERLAELEPELDAQLQEVLETTDHLEDLVKHSVLRDPPEELWRSEDDWQRVLIAVAGACLAHDVRGVVVKILAGELPRLDSGKIHEPQ